MRHAPRNVDHRAPPFLSQQGKSVEWRTELVEFRQNGNVVSTTLKRDGQEEIVETQWLIGADGGRSAVREMLNIPFVGETYKESLFVLDCKINWHFKADEAAIALSKDAFGLFFPMTNGRCRVSGIVSEEYANKETTSFEEVDRSFAKDLRMDLTLSDPQWISLYHSHHRYVANFCIGRCFLAGDAAHIHSPVGAQGMNTGLQDAYNLAWKLALVIQGKARQELLDTYQNERLPIATRLVRTTDRLFGITVSHNPPSPPEGYIRVPQFAIRSRIFAELFHENLPKMRFNESDILLKEGFVQRLAEAQ